MGALLFAIVAFGLVLLTYGVLLAIAWWRGKPLLADDEYQLYRGERCDQCGGDHWSEG